MPDVDSSDVMVLGRSADEAMESRKQGCEIPVNIPDGVICNIEGLPASEEEMVMVLKGRCGDMSLNGGWALKKIGRRRPTPPSSRHKYGRGQTIEMACAHHNCKLKFVVEETLAGWVVVACSEHTHNHPLIHSSAEAYVDPLLRSIPQDLLSEGIEMRKDGASFAMIFRALKRRYRERHDHRDPPFVYMDIYHKLSLTPGQKAWDATGFMELLLTRSQDLGLYHKIKVDADSSLERAFFVTKDAEAVVAARPKGRRVILVDTTHGTNAHNLKLALFTTVDSFGGSRILACALLLDESTESFQWAFENFQLVFGGTDVVFTDEDPAMAAAIDALVGSDGQCLHLLCIYHISKNFWKHMRSFFVGSGTNGLWNAFVGAFWSLAKDSDVASVDRFEDDWKTFIGMVEPHLDSADSRKAHLAREWLERLKNKKSQWAARFTWSVFTYGIDSTQRAEAVHSAVKGFLHASMQLTDLVSQLDRYVLDFDNDREMREIRLALNQATNRYNKMPIIEQLEGVLTGYALRLLRAQASLLLMYRVFDSDSNATYNVGVSQTVQDKSNRVEATIAERELGLSEEKKIMPPRICTMTTCSCQYYIHWGLPCRHMLRLYDTTEAPTIPSEVIADVWRVTSAEDKVNALLERRLNIAAEKAERTARAYTNASTLDGVVPSQERYGVIMSECRPLAEMARARPEAFIEVRRVVQATIKQLRGLASEVVAQASLEPTVDPTKQNSQVVAATEASVPPIMNPKHKRSLGKPQQKRKQGVDEWAKRSTRARKK